VDPAGTRPGAVVDAGDLEDAGAAGAPVQTGQAAAPEAVDLATITTDAVMGAAEAAPDVTAPGALEDAGEDQITEGDMVVFRPNRER
ncbi:MAG: hypothetical protein M3Q65_00685, partial [Chloroflexota bacterium]|nr:hypothetical protein [Chloroflexota bacterium]